MDFFFCNCHIVTYRSEGGKKNKKKNKNRKPKNPYKTLKLYTRSPASKWYIKY